MNEAPRTTRTVRTVRSALDSLDRAVSAQEIYRLLHDRGESVGLASVYRALDQLVATQAAERIRRQDEDTYVLCPPAHHHHAICRTCGRVDLLEGCPLAEEAETEHGFRIEAHQAVYYGRCPFCAEERG